MIRNRYIALALFLGFVVPETTKLIHYASYHRSVSLGTYEIAYQNEQNASSIGCLIQHDIYFIQAIVFSFHLLISEPKLLETLKDQYISAYVVLFTSYFSSRAPPFYHFVDPFF